MAASLAAMGRSDSASMPAAAAEHTLERVELVAMSDVGAVEDLVAHLGGRVEVTSGDRVQALVPAEAMPALEAVPDLLSIDEPGYFVPLQVADDVGALLGAERWNEAGFTGRGVKVAVVDAGFRGYMNRLGTSLPAKTVARSFRADLAPDAGTDHGTLAAEVVHSIAPNAELYLLSFGTVTELSAAADFIASEGIDVVSFSLGFIHNGAGDGSGPVDSIVTRSTANGALWVVSAGNWARQHWSGPFLDTNNDSIHEFAPGVTLNGRDFQAGDLIILSLRWDDEWGAACSDFDLELFGPSGTLARASRRPQDCSGDPVEGLQVLATESGRYSARIVDAGAEDGKTLDLLFVGSPDRAEVLDEATASGSLSEPADHPAVVTVGATSPSGVLRAAVFSSRGPTADGRPKPEVVSPTGQGSPGQATFAGTSAAAPHVAALAAILAEARPDATPAEIRTEIQTRSVLLTGTPQPGAPERLANLGPLSGLGPLLPADADTAELIGPPPPDAGLAVVVYVGPNGYPVRFAQNLTEPRVPEAFFRFDSVTETFDRHIIGAPAAVQTFDVMDFGTPYVVRFAAP
ncbi:MAG: S8 family serine peptidase [Dehalococcoidia bacterium]